MADLTRQIVEQAYADGNCVIVGRGAQCILQSKADVFHVFVYAPFRVRVHRLRTRLEPGADIERRIHGESEGRDHRAPDQGQLHVFWTSRTLILTTVGVC